MASRHNDLGICGNGEALLAVLGDVGGLRVIDIGSGDGGNAEFLAGHGAEVTGFDPLGPARPWTSMGAGRYRLLRSGAESLPFEDGAVDVVLFIFSLHHIPDDLLRPVLAEAARVLRPDGRLYVAEPLAEGPSQEVAALFHDETAVRGKAAAVLAESAPAFGHAHRIDYAQRRAYRDFEQYADGMVANMRFNPFTEEQVRAAAVRKRFESVSARVGGIFDQPVRIDLLRR